MPSRKITEFEVDAQVAARQNITLELCRRDDATVVKALHETKTVDDVEALDKVTFFDQFFTFIKTLGVWSLLEGLDPCDRVRATIPWAAMVGVYVMRIVLGLPSAPQTEGVILTDPALMALFGLAAFVKKGMTERGLSRANVLPEVRGAFSAEVMCDTVVRISLFTLARTFNAVVKILAQTGYFPAVVHAVVDCTDCEATPKFRMINSDEEVASVTRKKRPDHRNNRHAPKVETTVWGWKVWLMFCPTSGIPIAVYVDRINVDDRQWMLALVIQGQDNLGVDRLKSVAFDRGFWDGEILWHVAQYVPFFIPGKSGMEITQEARKTALAAYQRFKSGLSSENGFVAIRKVRVVTGRGKNRREEEQDLVVVGISGLDCPTYAEVPPKIHSKKFVPGRLNAVVVIEDPNYPNPPKDEKHLVILTNAAVETDKDALFAYDRFDERGVIENTGNKQAKREWTLESPLEKSEAAVHVHIFFVFMQMALMAAFRAQRQIDEQSELCGEDTGMGRYRRAVERANRDKVIVRDGECYAIIFGWELAVLMGVKLRKHAEESACGILERYGAAPVHVQENANPPKGPEP